MARLTPSSPRHRVYVTLEQLVERKLSARKLSLNFDRRKLQQLSGAHLSRFRGRGMDFAEHRTYQTGDDPRSIDWKITARKGKPFTKVFHEEVEKPVLIMADQSGSMFFGSQTAFKSVQAAEVASLLGWAGLARKDRIGGLVFNDLNCQIIKPSRHSRQVLRLLECVESYNHALTTDYLGRLSELPEGAARKGGLNFALLELLRIARPGTQCFLVSDWRQFDHETHKLLFELNRHCQILAIQIIDPLELKLPPGRYKLRGLSGSAELELDTQSRSTAEAFHQESTQWQQTFLSALGRLGIGCAQVTTWEDASERLLSYHLGASGSNSMVANDAAAMVQATF